MTLLEELNKQVSKKFQKKMQEGELFTTLMSKRYGKYTGKKINPAGNIHVKDHVWLAIGVTVLKDVTIGKGSIVGIHSVLTKSIKDFPNSD